MVARISACLGVGGNQLFCRTACLVPPSRRGLVPSDMGRKMLENSSLPRTMRGHDASRGKSSKTKRRNIGDIRRQTSLKCNRVGPEDSWLFTPNVLRARRLQPLSGRRPSSRAGIGQCEYGLRPKQAGRHRGPGALPSGYDGSRPAAKKAWTATPCCGVAPGYGAMGLRPNMNGRPPAFVSLARCDQSLVVPQCLVHFVPVHRAAQWWR